MNLGFWTNLKKPIMALAPMAQVTDSAFRQIICKYGKPDVCFTEFVSTDGLCSIGRENLLIDLVFNEIERPIVAQIWGSKPENFYKTADLLTKLGFDGIDINMGCPEKNIQKQGGCAALIINPNLAKEIILATKEGAKDLPISVKTRTGYNQNVIEKWISALLETEPAAITVHGRTKKEMSNVPADWEAIGIAAKIVHDSNKKTLIMGNGDVKSLEEAREKALKYGTDGVMIGRGVFGNPWFFNREIKKFEISLAEILGVMLEHCQLFKQLYAEKKPFLLMRKHFGSYVSGFEGAKALRMRLMEKMCYEEVEKEVREYRRGEQISKIF